MSSLSTEQKAKVKIYDNVAENDVFRGQGGDLSAAEWQEFFDLVLELARQPNTDPTRVAQDFYELAISAASAFGSDDPRTLLATLFYAYHQALEYFNSDQLLEAGAYALSALEIEPKIAIDEEYAADEEYLQTVSKNAKKVYFASMLLDEKGLWYRSPMAIPGVLQETLESPQVVERHQAALAYLYLAQSRSDIADWASKPLRIGLKRELAAWLGDELEFDERTQWHKMWPLIIDEFRNRREDLRRLGSGILESETVVDAANYLTSFVRALKRYVPFASAQEQDVIQSAVECITHAFGEFLRERETVSTVGYRKTIERLESLEQLARHAPFWARACVVGPISLHVRQIIEDDYRDRASRFYPELKVEIARPGYPLVKNTEETIGLHISNSGTSEALDVFVRLSLRADARESLSILTPELEYGTVPVTLAPISKSVRIKVRGEISVAYLECELVWTDLMGERSRAIELRLARQHEVDWDKHQANPYFLRSIGPDEHDRLKGRENTMVVLRHGIKTMSSFYITGQKRVGKTSIATTLQGELEAQAGHSAVQAAGVMSQALVGISESDEPSPARYLPIYVFWGDLSGLSPAGIFHFLANRLASKYQAVFTDQFALAVPALEVFEQGYGAVFTTFMADVNHRYEDLKVIFIIDDFDEIESEFYTGPKGNQFFTTLRAHINRENTSFIFVSNERIQLVLHYQGERLNQVQPIRVDYLDNSPEFAELVKYPTRGVLEFTDRAISEVYRLSAGNPYYAMLICNWIYRIVWERRNAWVVTEDVREAADRIVQEADQGQFSHFWTQGPHVGTEMESRVTEANKLLLHYIAGTMRHSEEYVPVESVVRARALRMYDPVDLKKIVAQLVAGGVLQRDPDQQDKVGPRVPLLSKWLQGRGGDLVIQGVFADEQKRRAAEKKYQVSRAQIERIVQRLYYQDQRINEVKIELWLEQFEDAYDRHLAFRLLERLVTTGYVDSETTTNLVKELYGRATSDSGIAIQVHRNRAQNVFVTTAKSREALELVSLFRSTNRILSRLCGSLDKVVELVKDAVNDEAQPKGLIVFVDDFIGSGMKTRRVIERCLEVLDQNSPAWVQKFQLYYAALAGYAESEEKLNELFRPRVKVLIGKEFGAEVRAFEPNANIFDDETDRETAYAIARRIGVDLCPEAPLGWGNSQSLVLFSMNCPSSTLPIFWKDGDKDTARQWRALFPRVPISSAVAAVDRTADAQSSREMAETILKDKIASGDYDVFLCHNSQDKPAVKAIDKRLKERGILPWLDERDLRPGLPWQKALEEQIENIKAAAVFIGPDGVGPWQEREQDTFLRQFVKRGCPVIPVILQDCKKTPKLPAFLEGMTWVDFRKKDPDPLDQLIWGITGERDHLR
jgi:hypothetical protein